MLTVWEPFRQALTGTPGGFGLMVGIVDIAKIDEAARKGAEERAEEGVRLAREAGMSAEPRTCSRQTTTAEAILDEAEELGAKAIVIGSRGLTGVKSMLLGSVSHAVVQHADLPVIVVPSEDAAALRARHRSAGNTPG